MSPPPYLSRRHVLTSAASASSAAWLARYAAAAPLVTKAPAGLPGPICLFSKHLPRLAPKELAQACKRAGFSGVDLTVRKGGHIAPAKVEADLPPAAEAIRGEGMELPHITTDLATGTDPFAAAVLKTAGRLKIPLFRADHIGYAGTDIAAEVKRIGAGLTSLAKLARAAGTQMLYQNHAGDFGAPLWDLMRVIEPLDPRSAGVEFDIRHAVAEGGFSAWRTAFHLIAKRLGMICLKDFYWKKPDQTSKTWKIENVPIGEGMVDFPAYFALLAKVGYRGPISLHIEYLDGADRPGAEARTLAAAEKDLKFVLAGLRQAYGA